MSAKGGQARSPLVLGLPGASQWLAALASKRKDEGEAEGGEGALCSEASFLTFSAP